MPHWSETLHIKCIPRPPDETLVNVGEQIIDIILDDGESTVEFDITIKIPSREKNVHNHDNESSSKSIETLKNQILELSKLNSQLLHDSKTKYVAAESARNECLSLQISLNESKKKIENLGIQLKDYDNLKESHMKLEGENADLKKEIIKKGAQTTQQSGSQYDYVILLEKRTTSLSKRIEELERECATLRRQRDDFEKHNSAVDKGRSSSPKKSNEASTAFASPSLRSNPSKFATPSQDGNDVGNNSTTAMRKEMNMLKNKLAELSTQMIEKNTFIDSLRPKFELEQQQNKSLRSELHVSNDSLRDITILFNDMRRDFDSKLHTNQQDIINLQNIIEHNNEIIAKMKENEVSCSNLHSQNNRREDENNETTKLKNKLKQAETEFEELFKANDELTNLLNESRSKSNSNNSCIVREKDLSQQIENLKGKLKSMEAELIGSKREKDDNKTSILSLKMNEDLLRDQIEDLKAQLRSKSPQTSLISTSVQEKDVDLLNRRLKKADDQIAKLKAINKENQGAVAAYQKRDVELSREVVELEVKLSEYEGEIDNLKRELNFLRNDNRSQELLSSTRPTTIRGSNDTTSKVFGDDNQSDGKRNDENMINIDFGIDLGSPISDLHGAVGSFFTAASDTITGTGTSIFSTISSERKGMDILVQEYESKIKILSQNLELIVSNDGNTSVFVEECQRLTVEKRDLENQMKKLRELFDALSVDKKNIASDLANANCKISYFEEEIMKLKAENSDLLYLGNTIQESTEGDYMNKYILSEERNMEYDKQIKLYSDKLKESQSKVINLERELHESNQTIIQHNIKIADLSTKVQVSNGIKDEKYILNNELNKVLEEINDKNKKIFDFERVVQNKNSEIDLMKSKADECESSKKNILQLKQDINDLSLTNQRLGLVCDEVNDLRKENSKMKVLTTEMHIAIEESKQKNDQLIRKLSHFDSIKEQLAAANSKIIQLSSVHDNFTNLQRNDRFEEYKGKYEACLQELQTTKYQLLELKSQMEDLCIRNDRLNDDMGLLQGQNYNDKDLFDKSTKLLLSGDTKIEDLKKALAEVAEENQLIKSQLSEALLSNNEGLKNTQTDLDIALKANEDLSAASEEIKMYKSLFIQMQNVNAAIICRCQFVGEIELLKKQIFSDIFKTQPKNESINAQNSISLLSHKIMSPPSYEGEVSKIVMAESRGNFFSSRPSSLDNKPKTGILGRVSSVFSSNVSFKQTDSSRKESNLPHISQQNKSPISENENHIRSSLSTPSNSDEPPSRFSDLWDRLEIPVIDKHIETMDTNENIHNDYNDNCQNVSITKDDSAVLFDKKPDEITPQEDIFSPLMGIGSFFTETINPMTYISPLSSPIQTSSAHTDEKNIKLSIIDERRSYNSAKKSITKSKMRESRRHGRVPTESKSDVGSETGSITDIPVIGGLFKAFS